MQINFEHHIAKYNHMKILTANYKEITICLFTFFILFIFPGTVPAPHFDELWFLFKTKNLFDAKISPPLNGMNSYTGAIQIYLLFPILALFGFTIKTIRITNALINTSTLLFLIYTVKALHPNKKYHLLFGIITAAFPFFACMGRFAVEITSTNFLLTSAGFFFITTSFNTDKKFKRLYGFLSGLSFGLASYNHMLSILPFASFSLALLIFYRKFFFKNKILKFVLLGFILGFAPRIASLILIKKPITDNIFIPAAIIKDIPNLIKILIEMIDGKLIFLRFAGDTLIPLFPYFSSILIILLWLRFAFIKKRINKTDKVILTGFFIMIILLILITPRFSIRYFLIPMLFAPYLLARLASSLGENGGAILKKVSCILTAAVILLNIFYLTSNYFVSFLISGGKATTFRIGERLVETSAHFILADRLYKELINKKVKAIVADVAIIMPVLYHDIDEKLVGATDYLLQNPDPLLLKDPNIIFSEKSARIYYNPVDLPNTIYYKQNKKIVIYKRDRSFDPNFAVFLSEQIID